MKPIVVEEAQRGFIHHGAGEGGRHRLGPEGRGVGGGLSLKHKQTFFRAYSCLGRKKKTCYMCDADGDAESMTHVTHPGDGGGDGDGDAESMTPVTHPGVISSRYLDTHVNSHTFLPPLTY